MEGLIPLFLNTIRKQRPQGAYRTLSEGSNRSYHLLVGGGGDSFDGSSSRRRSRSEFQPPPVELSTINKGSNMFSTSMASGSTAFGDTYGAHISMGANNISSNLRHRR